MNDLSIPLEERKQEIDAFIEVSILSRFSYQFVALMSKCLQDLPKWEIKAQNIADGFLVLQENVIMFEGLLKDIIQPVGGIKASILLSEAELEALNKDLARCAVFIHFDFPR